MADISTPLPPASSPPPKGPKLRVALVLALAGLLVLLAGVIWSQPLKNLAGRAAHPAEQPTTEEASQKGQLYTCGMHPWVILPKPGNCPICQMPLVPLNASDLSNTVTVSPEISQSIGVRVAPITSGPLTRVIRTVGTVDYDETLVRDVNLKISGWIQKLYADSVGMPVHQGEPLFDIYSPDLYTAQEEYLQALKATKPAQPASGEAAKWDSDLLQAARQRLANFDIASEQIAALEQSGQSSKTMTIRSPYSGLVVQKNALEGMKVDAGTQVFRIADLSKVWVMVTLYEYQLPYVQVGQKAIISLPYIPGQTFEGRVAYIYPYLNPELRQAKVRLEFDNPNLLLKPGMFANVELHSTLASDRVLAPREAIIDTGERQVAFISLGNGKFRPQQVKLGVEAQDGMVEVLDGLKPGEMVVTSAQFLLDSESRLREALAKMVEGKPAVQQMEPAATTAAAKPSVQLPPAAQQQLNGVLDAYFLIGDKLASDTIEGVGDAARALAEHVNALLAVDFPGAKEFWQQHTEAAEIRGHALEVASAKDIAQVRESFADLGVGLSKLLHTTGIPSSYGKPVEELHCPMYREGQGGTDWLQIAGPVRNPYYGQMMLGCFDKRAAIPVSGSGEGPAAAAPQATTAPSSQTE